MCKCCQNNISPFDHLTELKVEELRVRKDYVRRNIPIILELVDKYNDIIKNDPQTANQAVRDKELLDLLAAQIIKYTI